MRTSIYSRRRSTPVTSRSRSEPPPSSLHAVTRPSHRHRRRGRWSRATSRRRWPPRPHLVVARHGAARRGAVHVCDGGQQRWTVGPTELTELGLVNPRRFEAQTEWADHTRGLSRYVVASRAFSDSSPSTCLSSHLLPFASPPPAILPSTPPVTTPSSHSAAGAGDHAPRRIGPQRPQG